MNICNVLGYVQSLTCVKIPSGCNTIKPCYRVHENALTLLFFFCRIVHQAQDFEGVLGVSY